MANGAGAPDHRPRRRHDRGPWIYRAWYVWGPTALSVLAIAAVVLVVLVLVASRVAGSGAGSSSGGRAAATTAPPERPARDTTTPSRPRRTTTTTTAPPTTTSTTTTRPARPSSITLAFSGDLLPHEPVVEAAARAGRDSGKRYDFAPLLAPMKPIVAGADVAICHLETPVAPDQGALSGYPAFGGPVELVDAVRDTGYDGCSTASNHSLDRGRDGIAATLQRLDEDRLRHAGTARTPEEGAATTVYDVKGIRVAHLSYAYGFNGYEIPADAPWSVNRIDAPRIRADAVKARYGGADLVVVSLHWGTEYRTEPDAYQREVASQLLGAPGIDLVIGHHAHVVQPIEQINGTYVVWGLGNQLANQRQVPRSDGLTAVATATEGPDGRWRFTGIQAVPTYVEAGSFRVLPVAPTLGQEALSAALRSELEASYDRTAATVLGPRTPGVTVAPKP